MFNGVEYVRKVCIARKIPISQLEKDCGFSNGYLNPKKMQKLPYDRAKKLADYLDLPLEYLLNGEEAEKAPTPEGGREITFDDFTYAMHEESKDLPQAKKDMLLQMARFMRQEEEKGKQ